ncbi:Alpha/Beta hydrolase protein [Leptodontidium sp. 2 PMI_412]|nr:proline iminopeptidase [Leptodontidium sp. MPI-SDFR-AT-0119]KAH9215747.1 Alpha/Beta hydrolase protein [Leptodontidium sp. 2 PMI_412]
MKDIPITEGEVDFHVEDVDGPCKTWYKIFGHLTSTSTPLICLHGGPGVPHNYLLSLSAITANISTPVIVYDQLGCGKSTHLPSQPNPEKFWTPNLFLDELQNLIKGLGIEKYSVLGQSWGGMLGAMHAIQKPKGLQKLVIADSPASMELWVKAAEKLKSGMPEDVQEVLERCEKEGKTDSEEYEAAVMVFYQKHLCRVDPFPKDLVDSFEELKKDATVYGTMNGPSEFFVSGTLKTWTVIDEVHKIEVPTLLINGRYDEAQDEVVEPFFRNIKKVKWVRFAESSHMPHLEEADEFMEVVQNFIAE